MPLAVLIPDDYTVWACSDLHGMATPFWRALTKAGLVDHDRRWIAKPKTSLVVCGDTIDRGPDSWPLVDDLMRLRDQAAAAGSLVVLVEGNHEWWARIGLSGAANLLNLWLSTGGLQTLESLGIGPDSRALRRDGRALAAAVRSAEPGFARYLAGLVPYATWRDVLFVHGGPVPNTYSLEAFARESERMLIREDFLKGPAFPTAPVWRAFADAGIRRAVVGHTPGSRVRTFHSGSVAVIDTNAASDRDAVDHGPAAVTLMRVPTTGSFAAARLVVERSK